tara:strand:+ start:233 stop:646 length:414 start_codon:yes stop_codon:yes gene_type:complete
MSGKGVVIGVVALVILFVLVVGFSGGDSDNPAGTNDNSDQVAEVFSRSGRIVSVEGSKIEIDSNGVVYTILTDSKTKFIRRIIPEKITPGQGGELFKSEDIGLSDLKAGDTTSVVSDKDISGKNEFRVDQVQIVVVD